MSVPRMVSGFLPADFLVNLGTVTVYGVIWGRAIGMGELEEIGSFGIRWGNGLSDVKEPALTGWLWDG